MTLFCTNGDDAVLTATDNCGSAEVSYKETRTDGNCPSNYTLVRVWTAEDECGNTVHKQTITAEDEWWKHNCSQTNHHGARYNGSCFCRRSSNGYDSRM
ncbi:hypothetical protein H9X57_16585 [Flavobacterium piscinae]|uniref:hypothetical protein n=1 Tax=Flavobacterium piscinae TaxID=2506424 RepID=UPI0019B24B49|nr:hypothetical protein [Flavobacterium piscinae]MBC8884403.1 hypothetical protein [Flavobacterium piscinae]